jgi:hypothetical protein
MRPLREYPETYEQLVAWLLSRHPRWTREDAELYIAQQQRRQGG